MSVFSSHCSGTMGTKVASMYLCMYVWVDSYQDINCYVGMFRLISSKACLDSFNLCSALGIVAVRDEVPRCPGRYRYPPRRLPFPDMNARVYRMGPIGRVPSDLNGMCPAAEGAIGSKAMAPEGDGFELEGGEGRVDR
jgi:hypothetical protein